MHLFAKISRATPPPRFPKSLFTKPLLSLAALGVLSLLGQAHVRAAEPRVALAGAVSPQPRLRGAHLLGRLGAAAPLRAALILPLRNQSGLQDLLRHLYTPGDALYHHFLKPSDFTARFGPTPQDYAAVAAYARAQGLQIEATSPGRTLLSVSGPSARIESAFGVQMGRYRMADGRTVYANRAAPVLPRSVAARLAGIAGLSSIAQMHPQFRRLQPHAPQPINGGSGGIGSGDLGGLTPNDIKYAYDLSAITPLYGAAASTTTTTATAGTLDGTGQNIGLFELDGFAAGDISQYAGKFGLPTVLTGTADSVTVTPVLLGGFKGAPLSADGQTEVTLDIDMALALAPAAAGVYVYEDNGVLPTDPTFDASAPITIFTQMVGAKSSDGSPLLSVISCSWGIAETLEDPTVIQGEDMLFQQMAAQGQSLFCASGDNGAYDLYTQTTSGTTTTTSGLTTPTVDNPASQPYATGVGGTKLSYLKPAMNLTTGAVTPGTYEGETVWSAGTPAVNPEGSGGGVSTIWSKPAYQLGFGASPQRRDVPDVSLNADPNTGYIIYVGSTGTTAGTAEVIGGTSAAAPLWAAYTALINQQRTANGLTSTVGFLNPLLYPLAASSASYSADFHDITSGDNLFYYAGTGYDDASGLGSFVGAPLLTALSLNVNQGTGTSTVTGSVTDTSIPPVAVEGAVVTATSSATGAVLATATTDTTGAYTLSVPSGIGLQLTVTTAAVTAPAGESLLGASATLAALAADTSATHDFPLAVATHTYSKGLQMISAPFDYTGLGDFAAIFGLSAAQASSTNPRLVQYAPAQGSYVFYPSSPADTLRLGQGYWIRFPTAGLLEAGTPIPSTTKTFPISLQQGWNQIGDPFELAAPLATISVVNSAGATAGLLPSSAAYVQATLYSYSTSTGAYVALDPATDFLDPYVGYWIYAVQPCTLSVPNPGPPGIGI